MRKTFILHTQVYRHGRGRTRSLQCAIELKYLSFVNNISFCPSRDIYRAHYAQAVSTTNRLRCRRQENVIFQTLYLKIHTWDLFWYKAAEFRVYSIKYGRNTP